MRVASGSRLLVVLLVSIACGEEDPSVGDTEAGSSTGGTTLSTSSPSSSGSPTTDSSASSTTEAPQTSTSSTTTADTEGSTDTGGETLDDCDRLETFLVDLQAATDGTERATLTDAFLHELSYGEHGLPIRCGGQLGFVMLEDSASAISVAGDFNDWDPAAHPLQQPVADFPLRYALIPIDGPHGPSLYKFVRDGTDYFADPRARRFGWDEFGEYSLTDARPELSHYERWPDFDEQVGDLQPRTVTVYVPVGGLQGDPLPVLYMHDGQNHFAPDALFGGWRVGQTADTQILAGAVQPFFVVGIDNTPARLDEYSHVQEVLQGDTVGGRGDEYADFLVGGIKPFIDARYPTASERESTGVMGSSMGGLISLYLAYRHPDVFGFAACMSGTLGWGRFGGDDEGMADLYPLDPPPDVAMYLDSGGNGPCPNGGSDNYCETLDMHATLQSLGWVDGVDLLYHFAPDAPHNEAAWADRFGAAIVEWFPGD